MLALFRNHPGQERDTKLGCGKLHDEIYLIAPSDDGGFEAVAPAGIEDDPIQRKSGLEQAGALPLRYQAADDNRQMYRARNDRNAAGEGSAADQALKSHGIASTAMFLGNGHFVWPTAGQTPRELELMPHLCQGLRKMIH